MWPSLLLLRTICTLLLFAGYARAQAQGNGFDTLFVRDYSHIVTGRLYLSTKYNRMHLAGSGGHQLRYLPNHRFNMGFGMSYRALTLNIAVGIPGVNQDEHRFGRTRYLDAQGNLYGKRWATNLFLQVGKGYYTPSYPKEYLGWQQDTELPTRADLRQFNFGLSTVHVFNNDRFSYRAAFNQDAWQRQSQGSWLVGGYATYFTLKADSSLVPERVAQGYEAGLHMSKGRFADLGPMVGYAYTYVYREHWFVTASAVGGFGISAQRTELDAPGSSERRNTPSFGPGWHTQVRAGLGYNSHRRYIGMAWNQERIGYWVDASDRFSWAVGNVRVNYVYRFMRRLPQVDRVLR